MGEAMSNYMGKAKNKETGDIVIFHAMDDFYGDHEYGYRNTETGQIYEYEEFTKQWEWIKL